jgi:hypothetical protein
MLALLKILQWEAKEPLSFSAVLYFGQAIDF